MSNTNYNNDFLKALQLPVEILDNYTPTAYDGTDSCFREGVDRCGNKATFLRLKSNTKDTHACPHCGCVDHHESKGLRTKKLTHISNYHCRFIIEVQYRRYCCRHCKKHFKDEVSFKFADTMMTTTAAQACLCQFRENTAIAVISRMMGVSKSSVYRLFYRHVDIQPRFYHLKSVISVDEFRATSDKGTYAFHICDPINGKTLDIVEDRSASTIRNYFIRFPFKERKKVKIIVMDLSLPFKKIMHVLFPNAKIIADRFHYVRAFGKGLTAARLAFCASTDDRKLSKSIKRNLHMFDKYGKDLDDSYEWFDRHLKKHFTSKEYIEYVFEQSGTEEFYETYKIYQKLLNIIHEPHSDYKKELNSFLDHIFKTENRFYVESAKNIRSNWFMPVFYSLSYVAYYKRGKRTYRTSFNNGFIESMNNKVKLVKRNAYGYRYFYNLRKRILLHLGFSYQFV